MRIFHGYVDWDYAAATNGSELLIHHTHYENVRAWRENTKWRRKIAAEDAIHKWKQQRVKNMVEWMKKEDKKVRRFYMPKEQKYDGVKHIFG